MAGHKGTINYGIRFDVDTASLQKVKDELGQISKMTSQEFMAKNPDLGLTEAKQQLIDIKREASTLQSVLKGAFNQKLGSLNIEKFNQDLDKSGLTLRQVYTDFSKLGSTGTRAYQELTSSVISSNLHLRETHKVLDNISQTLINSAKWSVASSVVNGLSNSIQQAWNYTKNLNTSLNSIRVVTGYSADEMDRFALSANKVAKNIGSTTLQYTNAALNFYQQGLGDEDVAARTETTLKAANITGESTQQMADYLTAVWNGYKATAQETESYADKLAAVADASASDLDELATAMSKVASTASSMGVDIDQLNAQIATIIQVTRQAPESVGTALRTIYARINDIKAGTEESGVTLGNYSSKMAELGFNVLDASGKLRDTGDVMEEIGERWNTLSKEQQVYLAQTMAGQRQYNYMIALFDNWNTYTEQLNTSLEANGTLNKKNDIYLQSTQAHLNKLETAWQRVYTAAIDDGHANDVIDALTGIVNEVGSWAEAMGGMTNILNVLGTTATRVFSKQIAESLNTTINNFQSAKLNAQQFADKLADIKKKADESDSNHKGSQAAYEDYKSMESFAGMMSNEDIQKMEDLINKHSNAVSRQQEFSQDRDDAKRMILSTMKQAGQGDLGDDFAENVLEGAAKDQYESYTSAYNKNVIADKKDSMQIIQELKDAEKDAGKAGVKSVEDQTEAYTLLNNAVEQLKENLKELAKREDITDETKKRVTDAANSIETRLKSKSNNKNFLGQNSGSDVEKSTWRENAAAVNQGMDAISATFDELEKNNQNVIDMVGKTSQEIDQEVEHSEKEFETFRAGVEKKVDLTNIVNLVSSVGQLGTAFNTLNQIPRIWSDEDLSDAEKLNQVMLALLTSFGEAGVALKTIKDMLPNIAGALGATNTEGMSTLSLVKSIGSSLFSLAASNPEILLVVAAIAALAAGIGYLVKQHDKLNAAAERAKKAEEDLSKQAEEATTSFENLKDTFDAYDTAKNKLDSLTDGTSDWKDALDETNKAALNLLNNFNDLSADQIKALYSRDSSGMISINEDEVQKLIDQRQAVASSLNLATAGAAKNTTDAENAAALQKSIDKNVKNDNALLNVEGSNTFTSQNLAEIINKDIKDFANLTIPELKKKLEEVGVDVSYLSNDELKKLGESINECANNVDSASEKFKAMAKVQVDSLLGDKYSGTVKDSAANAMAEQTDAEAEKLLKQYTGRGISKASGSGNKVYQQMIKDLQDAGYNYSEKAGNSVLGTDDNRRFVVKDENGEDKTLTAEEVANMIAASKALKDVADNAELTSKALVNSDGKIEGFSKGLEGFIENGNLENLTQSQLSRVKTDLNSGLYNGNVSKFLSDQTGLSKDELKKVFGKDFEKNFKQAIDDYSKAFDKYTKNFTDDAQEAVKDLDDNMKDLSVTQKEVIGDSLNNARLATPDDDTLMNNLKDFYSKTDSSQMGALSNAISSITDWGSVSVEDLKKKLQEVGVTTNYTTKELQDFINNMDISSKSVNNFSSETYAAIHKVVDNLKTGSVISAEDFQTIYKQLGESANKYFQVMMDGTYKLVGSALELQRAVEDDQLSKFTKTNLDVQRNKIGQIQKTAQYQGEFSYLKSPANTLPGQLFGTQNTLNTGKVRKQLDIIQGFNSDIDQTKLTNWNTKLQNNTLSYKDYLEIAKAVKECDGAYKNFDKTLQDAYNELDAQEQIALSSARSLNELKEVAEKTGISENSNAFSEASLDLVQQDQWDGVDVDAVKDYAEYIEEIADESDDFDDSLSSNKDSAEDLARQIIRMNDGINDLADNWKNWSDILKNSSESSEEYATAMKGTKNALADILDLSDDYITNDFVKDHMDDIAKAADGDADAIDRLRSASLDSIIATIDFDDQGLEDKFRNAITGLQKLSDNSNVKIAPGMDLSQVEAGSQEYIDILNDMIKNGQVTAGDVNEALSSIGYSPVYDTETIDIPNTVAVTTTHHQIVYGKKFKVPKDAKKGDEQHTVQNYDDVSWTETKQQPAESQYGVIGIGTKKNPPTIKGHKLKGMTKKASGSYNNYSHRNSGGGSSGSGGGGGGSDKQPKQEDYLKDQADRYHQIDTQIQKVDNSLKKLQSQTEKYVGAKYLDNLQKQWDELNTQVKNYNDKLKIAYDEENELRSKLASQGVQFNADGTIANYMQAFQNQMNSVNGLISQYNGLSADAQEQWNNNKTLENAKDNFNTFKTNLDRYDELVSNFIPTLEQNVQDSLDKQIELNIKKFNYEIGIRLNLKDAEKDWNDWKAKTLDRIDEEDILGNANARLKDFSIYYRDDATGVIQTQTRHLSDLLAELDRMDKGLNNVYGDNRKQALEDLQTYYKQLMEDLTSVKELQDEIHKSYVDMMDEAKEKFDDQVDDYELISDTIQHDMKLIQMTLGENTYHQLADYYKAQQDNYNKQVNFQKQQVQFWRDQMNVLTENSDEWKAAKKNWEDALKDWQSAVEDALENIRDKFVNAINEAFDKLNNKVTDNLGLDYVEEQWDLIDKKADSYLDTINALQGINNLESKYLDSIKDTDNTAAIQKLRKAMNDELDNLRAQDKLTQADLDRAEKKYNLTLAQIALEEAQQNKSQLRLRRDSQGNYTYQYAADEDAVNDAKNQVGSLYADLYNFDKDQYVSTLDQIYQLYDEYQEKMAEAAQINDPEKRAQKELLVQEYYGELINGLTERNELQKNNLYESAFQDLAYLYNKDLESFTDLTQAEKDSIMEDLIPQWDSGVQHMVDVFTGDNGFEGTTKNALKEISDATATYDDDLHNLADSAGVAFDDVNAGIDETIDYTNSLIRDNDELINSYDKQLDAVKKVIDEVDGLVNKYNQAKTAAEQATEAAYKYWQEQQRQNAAQAAATNTTSTGSSNANAANRAAQGNGGSGSGNGSLEVGDTATYVGGGYYSTSYGGRYGNRGPGGQVRVTIIKDDGRPYPIHVTSTNSAYGWLRRDQLSGYDTGGYTGEWQGAPQEGKLALLHQKELVLNKYDTKNLLDTVSIMRNLTQTLGAGILNRLANISANNQVSNNLGEPTEIKQDVHIDAQFPNVKDAREIEDALNNLVNSASQRIFETK